MVEMSSKIVGSFNSQSNASPQFEIGKENEKTQINLPSLKDFNQKFFQWTISVNLPNIESYFNVFQEQLNVNIHYKEAAKIIDFIRRTTSQILCTENKSRVTKLLESLLLCLIVSSKNENVLALYYLTGQAYVEYGSYNALIRENQHLNSSNILNKDCPSSCISLSYLSKFLSGEAIVKNSLINQINTEINPSPIMINYEEINADNEHLTSHEQRQAFSSSLPKVRSSNEQNLNECKKRISVLQEVMTKFFISDDVNSFISSLLDNMKQVVSYSEERTILCEYTSSLNDYRQSPVLIDQPANTFGIFYQGEYNICPRLKKAPTFIKKRYNKLWRKSQKMRLEALNDDLNIIIMTDETNNNPQNQIQNVNEEVKIEQTQTNTQDIQQNDQPIQNPEPIVQGNRNRDNADPDPNIERVHAGNNKGASVCQIIERIREAYLKLPYFNHNKPLENIPDIPSNELVQNDIRNIKDQKDMKFNHVFIFLNLIGIKKSCIEDGRRVLLKTIGLKLGLANRLQTEEMLTAFSVACTQPHDLIDQRLTNAMSFNSKFVSFVKKIDLIFQECFYINIIDQNERDLMINQFKRSIVEEEEVIKGYVELLNNFRFRGLSNNMDQNNPAANVPRATQVDPVFELLIEEIACALHH